MSKLIHICKTIFNDFIYCSGSGTSNEQGAEKGARLLGKSWDRKPPIVQLYKQKETTITSTQDSTAHVINVSTNKSTRIKDIVVQVKNNYTTEELLASQYYKQGYINRVTLTFNLTVRYLANGVYNIKTIPLEIPGSLFKLGNETRELPVTELFDNIYNNKPLHSISIGLDTGPSVRLTNGEKLTTEEQIIVLRATSVIQPEFIKATLIEADTSSPILFSIDNPDMTRNGSLFIKDFEIEENPGIQSFYAYNGLVNPSTDITHWPEPSASLTMNNYAILHIGGLLKGYDSYNLLSQNTSFGYDMVNSSFDDMSMYTCEYQTKGNVNSWTSYDTGLKWGELKTLLWYDCIVIKTNASGTWQSYTLFDAIVNGMAVRFSKSKIDFQIFIPDPTTFVSTNFTNLAGGTQPEDFMDTFYPYNPLNLLLNIGYKTLGTDDEVAQGIYKGPYIDTKPSRRLFIGEDEVESFLIDEQD